MRLCFGSENSLTSRQKGAPRASGSRQEIQIQAEHQVGYWPVSDNDFSMFPFSHGLPWKIKDLAESYFFCSPVSNVYTRWIADFKSNGLIYLWKLTGAHHGSVLITLNIQILCRRQGHMSNSHYKMPD